MDYKETNNQAGNTLLDSEIGTGQTLTPGKSKRKKGGFNLLDLLIVLMLIAGICLAVYAYYPGLLSGKKTGELREVSYELVFKSSDPELASAIAAGNQVSFVKGGKMGTVTSVKTIPSMTYVIRDGAAIQVESKGLCDIIVTVKAEASDNGSSLTADGVRLAAGASYEVTMPGFTGTAVCRSLVIEAAGADGGEAK